MAKQVLNNGESGLIIRGKINDNFTELYTGKDSVTVANFAALPAPASASGEKWWCLASQGVYLVNRKPAGSYYSDGVAWTWLGDNPTTADQVGNVPAGGISATDVQAALNGLDTGKLNIAGTAVSATQLATGRTIAITGDLTYTSPSFNGTGNVTAAGTIPADTVTFAKMQNSTVASILVGRGAGSGAGDFQEITLGTNLSMTGTTLNAAGGGGGVSDGDYGDITVSGTGTVWTIDNTTVTFAKMQNSTAASVLVGRGQGSGSGVLQEVTLGANLTMTGTVLSAAGGSGSPGGTSGEVQYNNAGAFAGATNVEIDTGNLKLISTTDPTAPTGGLLHYAKLIAGRVLPKIVGPAGIDTIMQVGLHGNSVFLVAPASGTTAPTVVGGTLTTAATMSLQQTIASANPWQATARKRFTTAATAGSTTGMRTAYVQWFRGNASGFGGFWFRTQFGLGLNVNGAQTFTGLCASTAILNTAAGSVGALLNCIGVGYDTTDSSAGNFQLFRNDGSGTCTKVDLGADALRSNTTHGYDLIIYCPPGAATEIFVRIVNIHTGVIVLDTSYTTDIPAVNTGMAYKSEINNGAIASSVNIETAKVYIERDY